jgi:hypothetical protein
VVANNIAKLISAYVILLALLMKSPFG